jgi:ATP-dependent protease ClpP protease subunit
MSAEEALAYGIVDKVMVSTREATIPAAVPVA